MISRDRFELALERLKSGDWGRFERLASGFLVSEFPTLRTMASPSGDAGRDAELCSPVPSVVLQYSIRLDWATKIKETIKRIKETKPDSRVLIFVSNQLIGALADPVKALASEQGVFLDVRDRSWFGDRLHLTTSNEEFAEELAKQIVDPLLAERGVVAAADKSKLTGAEARTALFYLEMQWRDENNAKGLTRSCYEALVKVALRGTDSENRVSRSEVHEKVHALLPHYSIEQLTPFVDAALGRLTKSAVRHWPKLDEFNLSFEELQKIKDSAAGIELLRSDFKKEVVVALTEAEGLTVQDVDLVAELVLDLIEKIFLKRGEEFAACVARDVPMQVNEVDLKDIIIANLPAKTGIKGRDPVSVLQSVIANMLSNPSSATAEYVNILSDAYTLFAFRDSLDHQKATAGAIDRAGLPGLDDAVDSKY